MATFVEGKCCALSCTASSFWKKQHQLYLYMLSLCMGVCRPWRGDSNYWNVSTQSNTACLYAFSFLACNPILLHPAAVTRRNGSIKSLFVTRSTKISKFSLKSIIFPSFIYNMITSSLRETFFLNGSAVIKSKGQLCPGRSKCTQVFSSSYNNTVEYAVNIQILSTKSKPPQKTWNLYHKYIIYICHKFTASNMFTI